ncbi:MAG TPA: VCBS repeat-containing protein [Thermoanaerobaculia bacterium]|nr:VCBS repeat-containing protein [Thermoanaerobaculia bacterium]
MRFTPLVSLVCLALALPALAQTDEAIALQFYPERLRLDAIETQDEPIPPMVDVVRGDLTGSGSKFLVAGYSNGRIGAMRVIDVSGTPIVVGEDLNLFGSVPLVELFDLDRDGRQEIIVLLAAQRTDFTSIYKWNGSGLQLWGPRRTNHRGVERTTLPSVDYADLDGDGLLELIEQTDPESGKTEGAVYSLRGGDYAPATAALFHEVYVRGTGQPETVTSTFVAPGGDARWKLRIVNGDHNGANGVTAGEIRLNGAMLIGNDKLKQKSRTLDVPVSLVAGENVVEVTLRSNPGTVLTIALVKE